MPKVKICGITNKRDALNAVKLGADAIGFMFAKSPRRISVDTAAGIIKELPPFVSTVGVFVDADKEKVLSILKKCKLDVLQFHGQENDNYCLFFKKYCKIIKAFRLQDHNSLKLIRKYKNIDAILCDSFDAKKIGGTGKVFKWDLLKGVKFNKPLIIAGGVSSINAKGIVGLLAPFALDISSGVESSPGKKSERMMRDFMNEVNKITL
ncbi:MAG: phosphoribosylanthranilate isomerase [Candidatus Omnitrophota bacterium]